ncbi:MAG: acyl-CoA thioesterase [Blastocatellia bacterium]
MSETASAAVTELLREYPVMIVVPVAWGDMDARQHVNNVVYFRFFESGRIAYFERIQGMRPDSETPADPAQGSILASAACRYKFPLTYPDTLSVGTRVIRVEADRYTLQCRIVSQRHARIAAECEGVIVAYDYAALQKMLLPEHARRAIAEIERSAGNEL